MGYRHFKWVSWGKDTWEILHNSRDWIWLYGRPHINFWQDIIRSLVLWPSMEWKVWWLSHIYGIFSCKLEPDIWICQNGYIYEYISVYVDYLSIAEREPKSLVVALENKYKSKLNVTGPISFHIGCDFFRYSNGVLCFTPHKYIYKMVQTYMTMFGSNPKLNKAVKPPLEQGDYP